MRPFKTMRNAFAATVLVTLVTSAHAGLFFKEEGEKSSCFESHSRAWCVLNAANLTRDQIRDVKAQDLSKAGPAGTGSGDALWYAGAAVGVGSGFFKPAAGVSPGVEVGLLLLGMFGALGTPEMLGWNGVFGWMPADMAASEKEASVRIAGLLREASMSVFSGYELVLEAGKRDDGKSPYTLTGSGALQFRIKGGDCEGRTCVLKVLQTNVPVSKKNAPEWMGGGEAWGVATRNTVMKAWRLEIDGVDRSPEYLGRLSAALPPWMFIYVSPQAKTSWGMSNVGQRVPGVWNKGEFLIPVFPEPTTGQNRADEVGVPAK